MLNPHVNIGAKLSLSAVLPATYDAAGYGALTYTQIKGVRVTGRIGEKYALMDKNEIDGIRCNEIIGLEANSIPVEVIKFDSPGQTMLKQAFAASYNGFAYAYKFQAADGTVFYFTAKCSERTFNAGEKNTIADFRINLELNSRLLEI